MKKLIITVTTLSFLNLIGCYSSPVVNPYDYVETDSWTDQRTAGAKVNIITKTGFYSGELLTVRDSIMLICEEYEASEEDLSNSIYPINTINNHSIELMEVEGESSVLQGLAIGTGIGVVVGASAGFADGDDSPHGWFHFTAGQKACIGGFVLGGIGAIIGAIAGSFSSTYDKEIYKYSIPEDYNFTQLNVFSRYEGNEPDYLKAIK